MPDMSATILDCLMDSLGDLCAQTALSSQTLRSLTAIRWGAAGRVEDGLLVQLSWVSAGSSRSQMLELVAMQDGTWNICCPGNGRMQDAFARHAANCVGMIPAAAVRHVSPQTMASLIAPGPVSCKVRYMLTLTGPTEADPTAAALALRLYHAGLDIYGSSGRLTCMALALHGSAQQSDPQTLSVQLIADRSSRDREDAVPVYSADISVSGHGLHVQSAFRSLDPDDPGAEPQRIWPKPAADVTPAEHEVGLFGAMIDQMIRYDCPWPLSQFPYTERQ